MVFINVSCNDGLQLAKAAMYGGIDNLDDVITLVLNAEGVLRNHSTVQTLAWLRSYDSWYDEEPEKKGPPSIEDIINDDSLRNLSWLNGFGGGKFPW